jgi:hypothetical protein
MSEDKDGIIRYPGTGDPGVDNKLLKQPERRVDEIEDEGNKSTEIILWLDLIQGKQPEDQT